LGRLCVDILLQIQEKREKMIDSAKKFGFTDEYTIRCSQELDQLIYDYQCKIQKVKDSGEGDFPYIMVAWPENYEEMKYQIN
jgi:stage 0 sporulation regulatory protein